MFRAIKDFLFKNTSDKQTVIKNTIWLTISEFGSRLLKLVLFAYSARILSTHEWGTFSYVLALMGIFSILSDMGINTITTREVSKNTSEKQQYIATGFFIKILLSFFGVTSLILAGVFIQNESFTNLIPVICIFLFLDSIREYGFAVIRAFEKMEQEAKTKLFSNFFLVLSAVLLLTYTTNAKGLFIAYITATVVGLLFLISEKKALAIQIKKHINVRLIPSMIKEAWPIGLVAMLTVFFLTIDTIILGFFRDSTEIAYYSAAQKSLQLLALLPSIIITALIPLLTRLTKTEKGITNIFSRSISVAYLIITPIIILVIVFAYPIINILFGKEYLQAAPLLQITSISVLASIISTFMINALISYGKQKQTILFASVGAVSNIILSLLLIPRAGMYGAAISFVTTQIIMSVFMLIYTRKNPVIKITLNLKKTIQDIRKIFA